jgi:membrane fusion protein, adhesin transport system
MARLTLRKANHQMMRPMPAQSKSETLARLASLNIALADAPQPRLVDGLVSEAHLRAVATIAFFVLAFILWAQFTVLDKVVRGVGRVVPQAQNQMVQHFEGGIIADIVVQEGDVVKKGDVLLRIDNSFSRAELQSARLEIRARQLRGARLSSEASGLADLIFGPDMPTDLAIMAARELDLFKSRQQTLEAQIRILDEQMRQKELELSELNSRWVLTQNERDLVTRRLTNLRRLAIAGAVSQNELLDNERGLQQIETRISDLAHTIPRTEAALNELKARRGEISLRFRADAERERTDNELAIAKLEEQITAMKDRSLRAEVTAPIDGVVNKVFFSTVGGVVKSGETLVQLVPTGSAIAVEAKIAPSDRAQIWPGLPATVKVSAYDFSLYGGLSGKVIDISPDTLTDEKGQAYYRVKLEADAATFGRDKPVIPGMMAEVDILSGEQTILQALIRPMRSLKDRALRE